MLAQPRLGCKVLIQTEKALVEKGSCGLLHSFGSCDRFQGFGGIVGKGEDLREVGNFSGFFKGAARRQDGSFVLLREI